MDIEIREKILAVCKHSSSLGNFPCSLIERIIDNGQISDIPANTMIFEEGSNGTELFIIITGEVTVFKRDSTEQLIELARFQAGDFFGELNIFSREERTACIATTEPSKLLIIEGEKLIELVGLPDVMPPLIIEIARRINSFNKRYCETIKKQQDDMIRLSKLVSLGELIAGIAHEINTPIQFLNTAFFSISDSLTEQRDLIGRLRGSIPNDSLPYHLDPLFNQLDHIDDQISLCKQQISDVGMILCNMNKYAYQNISPLAEFDILSGLRSMLVLIRHELKDNIDIVEHFEDIPLLCCYPSKINQVLLNLLMNAVQAIVSKGRITIGVRQNAGNIVIEIEDTGKGVSADKQNRIFEKFFTTKKEGEGTGIGLYLARMIVNEHRGSLELVESRPGKTLFRMILPLDNGLAT